ncbi:MAG: DUF2341 domain-containing protein [Candidatus Thorarchaeota archaeon]
MRKPAAALMLFIIFLLPSVGSPDFNGAIPFLDDVRNHENEYNDAGWQDASSGTGAPRPVDFQGMAVSSGTSVIDADHPWIVGIDPPLGWSSEQLETQLDHLSMWVDDVLVNPSLDANHEEHWILTDRPDYNYDPFYVPDGWTIIKKDAPPSGTGHPQHGYFELNGRSGEGYDASIGWRFDANWNTGAILDPTKGIYISQQIPAPWREVYSAEITFRYYISSLSNLDDTAHVFTRLEGYVTKHHVYEVGTPTDTWLQAKATVPASYLQSLETKDALLFDIGVGTDLSGNPPASATHEMYIDEIEFRLLVRPFPEEINLLANGARVTGSIQGSVSPYVPDGSNRDCYSAIDSNGGTGGVDLNGYSDFGWLDVGIDGMDWPSAFAYQVGLQFPLNVPQGATITSAILEIETPSGATGDPAVRVYAAAEDDVTAFTTGYPLLPDRYDWVNTSVFWNPTIAAPGRYNTPDLSALIQEVVSRPGWTSGNYICIMIDYAFSSGLTNYIQIKGSTGFPQGQLAQLNVDFTSPDPKDAIPSFRYNKNIVLDHRKVIANLQNFPVLVDIWDADLHLDVQPDGDDIAFLYDGQVIPHEIDVFDKLGNGTHAHLSAWVNLPYVSSTQDTTVVMVYGDGDIGSQEKTVDVWDSDYSAVWHLSENPAQPQWDSTYADYLPHQPQILDVTSHESSGSSYGSMTSNDLVDGFIGEAIDLEGSNDYLDFGNPTELQMNGAFTVEAWFYADYVDNDYLVVKSGESNYRGWDISFDNDPSISPAGWVMFRWSPDGVAMDLVGYERVDTAQWYHAVGVFSPSEYARFYLNGELVGEVTSGIPSTANDPNRPLRIGRRSDSAGATSYFDGIVDEVRISSIARSDAWIRTQYSNQRNPELFMTVSEEGVNFLYKKDIVVDHTKVASDLTSFPMLVDIFDIDLRTDVQADGDDIMFTSNGRSLPHEIELFDQQYNSTHAHLVAWVKADLSSVTDTIVTMYYGNPSIGSQESLAEVWSNRYTGVWHLAESSGNVQDSTSYGQEGIPLGGVSLGALGKIGYASDFGGIDGYINMGDPADGHLDFGLNSFTICIWLRIDASTGTWQVPLNKGHPSGLDSGYRFETNTLGQSIYFQISDGISYESTNSYSVTFGEWMHLVGRVDPSTNEMRLFKDGGYSGTVDISGIGSVSTTDNFTISRGLFSPNPVDGLIDEIRISSTALSDSWIITEYNNQYDPSSFYLVGAEKLVLPLEGQYKKDIVIDHTKVDSDLTGFPLLVDIYDTDLKSDAQADGDDIIFKSGTTFLPHEIEQFDQDYNSTHAHLVAWVKTDLSSTADTTVTMYYGNPEATNQENPNAVWDDNYWGVWHLGDTSGAAKDSTSGGADGTLMNGPTQAAAGRVGYGYDFDGVDDYLALQNANTQSSGTYSFWVYPHNYPPGPNSEVNFVGANAYYNRFSYYNGRIRIETATDAEYFNFASSSISNDTWYHMVFVRSGDFGDLYINGVWIEQVEVAGANTLTVNSIAGTDDLDRMVDGIMDEVRISGAPHSAAWVIAEYRNQYDPASFYSVGAETILQPIEFTYKKDITIDHTKVGADVMDFPVLIDIYDTDLRTDVQVDGDDIVFAKDGFVLPHEIELFEQSYNTTHAHLVAWVKTDLSASFDTAIRMYYGNFTAHNQENPSALWGSSNVGTWHLSEVGDGSPDEYIDSSQYNNHGQGGIGTPADVPTRIDGKIGYGQDFDGLGDVISLGTSDTLQPSSLTWSAWVRRTSSWASKRMALFYTKDTWNGPGWYVQIDDVSTGGPSIPRVLLMVVDGSNFFTYNGVPLDTLYPLNEWVHLAASFDSTTNAMALYVNGVAQPLQTFGTPDSITSTSDTKFVPGNSGLYVGSMDEVRVASIVRSPEWILTEYRNQNDSASFYTVGAEIFTQPIEFAFKKEIVVDHTKIAADLTDFPMLVDIFDSDLKTKVQADGDDIVFKISETLLPHQIELFDQTYNSTHAHLIAWVKADLSSSFDTTLTMHYGNQQAPNQENPAAVWSNSYMGVWHLAETNGDAIDSTSYGSNGALQGGVTQGAPGWVDGAYDFDGSTGRLAVGNPADGHLDFGVTQDYTLSCWIYLDTISNPDFLIAKRAGTGSTQIGYALAAAGGNEIVFEVADGVDEFMIRTTTDVSIPAWYYVTLVWDDDSTSATTIYINGMDDKSGTQGTLSSIDSIETTTGLSFGASITGGNPADGRIDEVRISSVARPSEWIAAEFANQFDPSSFFSTGSEIIIEPIEFSYRKDIVVNHTQVDADLTEFPMLIDIYDTDLKTDVQADGDDIIFKISDALVPHEIELFDQAYNLTHAHLVAWVKTDLSSIVDTTISMYYGSPQATNQEDPDGVWNDNYLGVWHLGETSGGSGAFKDSTSNSNHGTDAGAPTLGINGPIGKAILFDGVDDSINCGNGPSLNIAGDVVTLEAWAYLNEDIGPGWGSGIVVKYGSYEIFQDWDATRRITFSVTTTGTGQTWTSRTNNDINRWYHVVGVYNGTTTFIYVDGTEIASIPNSGTLAASASPLYIGLEDQYYDGRIDEVRVSKIDRSAKWILAEFRNQNDPASFYTVGYEITPQPEGFDYRKNITIDNTKVSSDLVGFPLLIDIYDTDLKTETQADGDDIIFKTGEVALSHEIELFDRDYNSTHAHLVAWVKTDLLSTSDTIVTMYYGNPEAINQEDPGGVWDTSYMGVWHLSEPSGNAQDSTLYQTHGTPSGLLTQGVSGHIGNAYYFDRDGLGTVNMGDPADGHLDFGNTDDFTIEFWVDLDYFYYYEPFLVSKRNGLASSSPGYAAFVSDDSNGYPGYSISSDGPQFGVDASSPVLNTGWRHVVYVFDQDSDTISTIYVDGIDDKISTWGTIGSVGSLQNSANFRLNGESSPTTDDMFDGMLDEVRISNIARSSDWILTEFNNQNNPSSFYSIGAAEFLGVAPEYNYMKNITIDHTKVISDLTDFPLLIDIFDTDLRTDVQPDGNDIIFKIGTTSLPHEIELFDQTYNSTHAHLVAWVKIDLSSSVDTTITMYYGNPSINNQEKPSDVWNSNYVAVWHFNQDPSSTSILDSTMNGYHLTAQGFGSDQRVYDGKLGTSISVDGIDDRFGVNSIAGPINDMTFQTWFMLDNAFPSGSDMHLLRGNSLTNNYPMIRFASSSGLIVTHMEVTSDVDETCTGSKSSWEADTWFQFAWVRSTAAVRSYHYVNGSLDAEDNSADNANPHLAWDQLMLLSDFSAGNMWGPGAISEFRILNVVLPPEWIAAEYANQNDPASFYSVGSEVQIVIPEQPSEPSLLDASGYKFSASSSVGVTIGFRTSLGIHTSGLSYTDDYLPGTSFSIVNDSLAIWTANVLVSPPPEIESISFELSYPEGEWYPFSVKSPSGIEKTFATDWTCFDGKLVVASTAIDEYGMWHIRFQDRNHVFDTQMGLSGGPYSPSGNFLIGEEIQFRIWSSGTMSSGISLDLTDPYGSTWYSGSATFQGQKFALPYSHRKYLTISHENVATDLVNFPVLVDIYDTDLRTDVRADGRDIAFAIGEETLAHEIELFDQTFNSTHAHLAAWVKVPLLSGSSDTAISMYYGNPIAPIVYDSGPVWDSGYLGVWHLAESGTGALDEYTDSSQYKHHGQGGEGQATYVPTQVSGKIGFGQDFNNLDGNYDLIDCGDSPLWNIDGYQLTLEAWVQHDITPNTHIYGIMNHKGWYNGYSLFINEGGVSTLKPVFNVQGETHQLVGANDVMGGSWHHIVATYDGSLMRIYVDGVQDPNVLQKTDAILPSTAEQGFWIGHGDQPKDVVWSAEYEGQIDEVRISDVARPAGWIETQFKNQNDPSSFFSISIEQSPGYSESAAITLDSSAQAGVWQATARYYDDGVNVDQSVGIFSRNFIVKRGASMSLTAPGDAVSDGISAKLIGEGLYVEFDLSDTLTSLPISGATMTMNWTVSGAPTQIQLNDYGDGSYGRVLNTTDLGTAQRWRIELTSSHQFYGDAFNVFFLDLSHQTYLTYEPPSAAPYGDDFTVKVTLRDSFNSQPLANAGFASNGTIIGAPVDYGNGTYLLTIDSSALSTGTHAFRFTATPADSYLLSSSIDVQFDYREVSTDAYALSSDPAEVPWGEQASVTIHWYDLDHSGIGIEGGTASIIPSVALQKADIGGGDYALTIDTSSYLPGAYVFDVTFSKANYEDATASVTVIVKAHSTSVSADYSASTPVGTSTYFDISFLDLDGGSVGIGVGNLSQVTLDWGSGPQAFFPYGFWLDTSAWSIGVYTINITVYATTAPRYYSDAKISVNLEIRKLEVYVSWEHLEPFPNGDDFVMFAHLNISEPGSSIDGDPINGLTQAYFTARNETGWQYTFESFASLGEGRYQLVIDQSNFLEGEYTIVVYVDFLPAESYHDSQTPVITFTYRPILTYLSSDDYPSVTTTYDTNVTITLNYVDIDNNVNITTGSIAAEGASITWQHLGNGVYEVLVIVQGWNLGTHEVNITADAPSYQAKTLTFEVLVQIAYAYARSSDSSIDLPLGDTAVFYMDYWDIIHDGPILDASIDHNWTHALTVIWTGSQYRVELPSLHTDSLGSYFILFNVSKGSNYQFGYFNLSLTLRTHYTEVRFGSAVEPTTYIGMVNVSLYYGDLDNDIGVASQYINVSVYGESGWIDSTLENDTASGDGYYIIRFPASILGESGIYNFTVYVNWTGPTQQFYNGIVRTSVNIIGEESELSLEDSPGPTPYLENMSYTYFYDELYSGVGISNATGDVFIFIEFVGESVDTSLVSILEGLPGYYTLEFNTTIFARPGVFTMVVQVNWSASASPFYDNRTDTISVRVIPRNTVVSVTPPDSTAYGINATFSFSYDDVSNAIPVKIPNDATMTVVVNLPDYSISYNSTTRQFHISFNTSVLGASLGNKQFTISITWIGSPFYANITARTIFITVANRETSFDFATPSPTPYGEMAAFTVTYMDAAGAIPSPINDGTIVLYNDSQPIPVSFYSYVPLGNGQYTIELNTSYFSRPNSYNLEIQITTPHFYYLDATGSRTLIVRYRITTLTAESAGIVSYNSSIPLVLRYSDLFSLAPISNSSLLTSIEILNGSSWIFTSDWRSVPQDYLVTVQTFNQILDVDTDYVLWIRFTYADAAPFYLAAETFVSFRLRERTTYLDVTESPLPTPYLDFVNFTVAYRDLESSTEIGGANIVLSIDAINLIEGTEYILQTSGDGIYHLSINTTAIGIPGVSKSLVVSAEWTSGAPYYTDSTISLTVSVVVRPASVRIIISPSQVRFLDNITFTFSYNDDNTDDFITLTKNMVSVYSGGSLLQSSDFTLSFVGNGYKIGINSIILSPDLVTNWNVTVFVDWSSTVPPYYSDDAASVGVTVVNRIGSVSLDNAPTTPIGDNMTLAFSYEDQDNGLGIGDAIVVFDCLNPSGLGENADFWIVRGVGPEFGEYTILVDTSKLSGVGLYTFSLRLQWNQSIAPYYRNTSEVFLIGSVRLIQSQLDYEDPIPTTVPINDNVSVVLTFTDSDHLLPIAGAENNISVTYKSDGSVPSIWSITVVVPGMYELVVNCTDAGSAGTNALVIQVDLSDYQFAEVQVPIQIRSRQGELTKVESPDAYFGEQTYAIVELVDIDASSAPIHDATLNLIWPETSSYVYIGNGMYNVTLDTTTLDADLYTLVVSAQKANYFIPEISISIRVQSIPTEVILPQTVPDVYWGESVSIWALFNDTRSGTLILGAAVNYQFGILSGSLAEGPPGNYSFTIDTGNLPLATTYLVSITARLDNYDTVSGQITVNILRLNLELTIVDGLNSQELYKGEPINITVFVRDVYNDVPLTGATVSATWVFDMTGVSLMPVPGMNGYYTGLIPTVAANTKTYSIVVSAEKTNYLTMTSPAEVNIRQILTKVNLDPLTETYSNQVFDWTDTIRIGVFVLAPSLNDTGLSNCTVTWSLSGTFLTGEFLNGSSIEGPGYFYFDFNTWEHNATTYTLRFTAYPLVGAYATSSNMTTIAIRLIQTTVESTFVAPKVWGWAGWVNLTYWNLLEDRGVVAAEVGIDWEGIEQQSRYLIDGVYQVWVNTSLVSPGVYPVVVSFWKQNYEAGTGVFTLTVKEVPTEIVVYAPSQYQIDGNVLNLQIPYGDSLPVTLFYNDTWYNQGISNASDLTAVILHPSISDKDILLVSDLSFGNYSLEIDSSQWVVSPTHYRVVANLGLENRSRATLNLYITIINIPTALTAEPEEILMGYLETTTIRVFYYDIWEGHDYRGIPEGFLNATPSSNYVTIDGWQPDPLNPGWYEITLSSGWARGPAVILIELTKDNHDSAVVSVGVSVEPSEFNLLIERSLIYGLPFGVVCLIGAILWSRLFSLPKRLREIRGMVKDINRGRIPKVPDGVQNRREILTELFNEIIEPIGIVRSADSMPEYSLVAEVPEMEELLIQLSILTQLTPEELDDFRADVTKMKLSEQAAFIKEVISQEVIKRAKMEKKSIEKIHKETLKQARALISGKEIVPPSEPVVSEEEAPPKKTVLKQPDLSKAKDELPPEIVSQDEIVQIRKRLVEAGIGGHELETIMEQVQDLPRDLVEDLINSILKKGGDKP